MSSAGRDKEEAGTGGLVPGGGRGGPQTLPAGIGQRNAATGGEDCSL